MRKFLFALLLLMITSTATFAREIPGELKDYVEQSFPKTKP